nr:retrovirus-related Pol polyprotein from transposon TNT 1-94 [Tanacetum cinerariifolium]
MINENIKLSKAYKTYLEYATGKVPPKKARKFKKPAAPKLKIVPASPKEPTLKDTSDKSVSKKKAPAKTGRGKGIELLLDAALLEEAQMKKALKKSKHQTHNLQASGSSEGADFESEVLDERTGKTKYISEGTGVKPGVPDVSKDDSSDSNNDSWGDSEDESDDDHGEDDNYDEDDNDDDDDFNITRGLRDTDLTNAQQGEEDQLNASHKLGFMKEEEDAHVTLTMIYDKTEGSLSLTQCPNSLVRGESLEIRDDHLWYVLSKSDCQSLHALRPSMLCAQAESIDDMPFRKRAFRAMMSSDGSIVASLENVNGFQAVYTPPDDLIRTDFKQEGVVPKVMLHIFEEFVLLMGRHSLNNEIPCMVVCKVGKPWDADHAGCIDTRKSTSRGIQFLCDKLVSWMSKKQDFTVLSSVEAEYVALSASCAQVMWMRTQLQDYGLNYKNIPLYCDSQSAIAISCNPIQHSCTKHIHTRYHFIKEQVENGKIELYFVRTKYQLADMFTKALPKDRFKYSCQTNWYEMFDSSRTGGFG